MNYEEVKLESA